MHSISTRALAHRFFAPKALRAGLLPERPTLTLAAFAIALRAIQVTYAGVAHGGVLFRGDPRTRT